MESGFRPRRPRRLLLTVAIVMAALTVLGVVHAVPRSEARPRTPAPAATLRVVMYETAPAKAVSGPAGRGRRGGAGAAVRSQLAALAWAGADAALVHWEGPHGRRSEAGRTARGNPPPRARTCRPQRSSRAAECSARTLLRRLGKCGRRHRATSTSSSRPAVFVAWRKAHRSCARHTAGEPRPGAGGWDSGRVPRLRALPRGRRRVVSGRPVARTAQARGSFLIRPGYWASSCAYSARDAFDRRLATLDPADGRLARVAPGDRLAQRLVARQRDRGEPRLGLGERLRPLPRRPA